METVYRDTVAAYVVSADCKILFGRKDPAKGGVYADCWHIPGGGIDTGETPEQAVKREILEETNLDTSEAQIQLVDDRGKGESIKHVPGKDDVLVKMTFRIYRVVLPKTAAESSVSPLDDLIDLTWFDYAELDQIKMVPPAYKLFERIGTEWLQI